MTSEPIRGTHHLPAGAHIADRRGLTATGAVAVALGAGIAGGMVDVMTGAGLRATFAVCFVLGCAFAAVKVHREDLLAAVVIPPLAYVALAVAANVGSHTTLGGSFVKLLVRSCFLPNPRMSRNRCVAWFSWRTIPSAGGKH